MIPPDFFTWAGLERFLLHAQQYGPLVPLREWPNGIVLRHDVDLSVEAAHILAQIERAHNIRATYFFMVSGPYNPLFYKHTLREFTAWGFEIGLHFNPSVYEDDLQARADEEARVLELATGIPIESISLHDPSGYGAFPLFEGYFNAYDRRIFSDAIYLSDSEMNLRGKDPYAFVESQDVCQMLFHPEHFLGQDYRAIFREHIRHSCEALDCFWKRSTSYGNAFPHGLSKEISWSSA